MSVSPRQAQSISHENQFPRTRYQGSKRKLASTIVGLVENLPIETVLDAFGGTGVVAYEFKRAGYAVTYNDLLAFNHQIGTALIENDSDQLTADEINMVCDGRTEGVVGTVVHDHFGGIYFTDDENAWIDRTVYNISRLDNHCKQAIAWFALFQSALAKRPYNLFHRANLYMRTADVKRSFGNKASWDRSFVDHFRVFAAEANEAVINGHGRCHATCMDVMDVDPQYDLIYIDPPYVNASGVGVDYRNFYHFLEGLLNYSNWSAMIDFTSKHKRLTPNPNPWCHARDCKDAFRRIFSRFRDSTIVVSYRDDGIPSVCELESMLKTVKKNVSITTCRRNQYALSNRRNTHEVLLIGS